MMLCMIKKHFTVVSVTALFCSYLLAEPVLGILQQVQHNNLLHFKISSNAFTCKNYGIVMIDEVKGIENTCKIQLDTFIAAHPEYHYFSQKHMTRYQQYHLNIIDSECLLYVQGKKSLSELLLENGLAVRDKLKKNTILDYKFKRSVMRAKNEKKGIYSDAILRSCVNASE